MARDGTNKAPSTTTIDLFSYYNRVCVSILSLDLLVYASLIIVYIT